MAKKEPQKKCFIIMPISTPKDHVASYMGDDDHFEHVLKHLFIPSITKAGFIPMPPKAKGSDVIQAEIIKHLSGADLVLCDMSILNPNVFFEFGIRTALDKPVALVVDDKTPSRPFDTNMIHSHVYDSSLTPWKLTGQINLLEKHVRDAFKKSENRNSLWKYFGVAQPGVFKPGDYSAEEKFDLIIREISYLKATIEGMFTTTLTASPSGGGEGYYAKLDEEMKLSKAKNVIQQIKSLKEELKRAASQKGKLVKPEDFKK